MTDDTPRPDTAFSPDRTKTEPDTENLAEAIRRRFAPFGGVDDLELPPREPARDPPDFDTADYNQPPPDWLQKACAGAKPHGLDALPADEIDAVHAGGLARRTEDDA